VLSFSTSKRVANFQFVAVQDDSQQVAITSEIIVAFEKLAISEVMQMRKATVFALQDTLHHIIM